jgi:D-xylulose reductase
MGISSPIQYTSRSDAKRQFRSLSLCELFGINEIFRSTPKPDPNSRASRLGIYNLDPAVRFWATPPVHGCLTPYVVHPAAYTFKLPPNVSFAEGAMVEPLAVGMQAALKAKIKPGDLAVVIGAGPIGVVTALAALAGGCSRVVLTDVQQPKLDLATKLGPDPAR